MLAFKLRRSMIGCYAMPHGQHGEYEDSLS
jgi:hypothetical protein